MGASFHSRGTGNNFAQFSGNSGLSGIIVLELEGLYNLSSILGSVLHSSHSGRLFGSRVVKESNPEVGGDVKFVESRDSKVLIGDSHLEVEVSTLGNVLETVLGHELDFSDFVGNSGLEFVVV